MKSYVRHEMGVVGWMEKPEPVCGPDDAICRPIALCPCSSDVHTAWEMDGPHLKDITLGHEALGEILEVGENVKDFKPGDKVITSKYSGTEIKLDGDEYIIVRQSDILAIVE